MSMFIELVAIKTCKKIFRSVSAGWSQQLGLLLKISRLKST